VYRRLLTNRNFVALGLGQLIAFIGDYFVILAVPIAVNRLTGSTMMVGLAYMTNSLPVLLLGPLAGVFVDRWDRRRVMIASDLLRAGLVLCLLLVRSREQVWLFYLIGFLAACVSQFFLPARSAVLPLIVPQQADWLAANGWMQISQTFGFIAGPALAGFAIGLYGEAAAFVANAAGYLVSALALLLIAVPRPAPQVGANTPPLAANTLRGVWAELREGLVYLFGNPTTFGVMVCNTGVQLGIGALIAIWVPFLLRKFGLGAAGVGLVDAIFGLGMVLGGFLLGTLAARFSKPALAAVGICAMGLMCAPMGYTPSYSLLLLENFIMGIFLMPVNSALLTMMQLAVPDQKRGRVSGSLNALAMVGGLASMAFASFFGERIGLENIFLVFGLILTLAGVAGFGLLKEPTEPLLESL
jgi:MFS family permease